MSIHDFVDRRQSRGRETVSTDGYITVRGKRLYVGEQDITAENLARATAMVAHYERHTTDKQPFLPSWDQLHDLEARLEHVRAKCVGMFVLGLAIGVCFGYWVLPGWVK